MEFPVSNALGRPATRTMGMTVTGYEIHHGQVTVHGQAETFPGGCRSGAVWGTSWRGTLENDEFRRAFLTQIAAAAGRDFSRHRAQTSPRCRRPGWPSSPISPSATWTPQPSAACPAVAPCPVDLAWQRGSGQC